MPRQIALRRTGCKWWNDAFGPVLLQARLTRPCTEEERRSPECHAARVKEVNKMLTYGAWLDPMEESTILQTWTRIFRYLLHKETN